MTIIYGCGPARYDRCTVIRFATVVLYLQEMTVRACDVCGIEFTYPLLFTFNFEC
jgi:hypothetical protein